MHPYRAGQRLTEDRLNLGAAMIGRLVARLRRITTQTIPNNQVTDVEFDQVDLDLLGGWNPAQPTRWTPPVPGWWHVSVRAVFATNSTSRRGVWAYLNSGPGFCGASVQAAGTGSTQCGGTGSTPANGTGDFIAMRVLQNSGGNLNLSAESTDQGSTMEIFYAGPLS